MSAQSATDAIRAALASAYAEIVPGRVLGNDTLFVGPGSSMESVDFVSFLLLVEEKIAPLSKRSVFLLDEKAFAARHSPFRSVETLVRHIEELLRDAS